MRNTTLFALFGLMATPPVMADDSNATILQALGDNNFATIEQTGTSNSQATILQWGTANTAGYSIDFDAGGYHYHFDVPGISQQQSVNVIAHMSQIGDGNEGTILQSSAANSTAYLIQEGIGGMQSNRNTGWIQQDNIGNDTRIDQVGEFNNGATGQGQIGGNLARIGQVGFRNSAGISQYGGSVRGFILQH